MKHYEINLTIKDVQVLSGFSYNSSKRLLQKVKSVKKIKPPYWISLHPFCSYLDINYGSALSVLETHYDSNIIKRR